MRVGSIGSTYVPKVKRNNTTASNNNRNNPAFKADVRVSKMLSGNDNISFEDEEKFNNTLERTKFALKRVADDNVLILVSPVIRKNIFGRYKLDIDLTFMHKDLEKARQTIVTNMRNSDDRDQDLINHIECNPQWAYDKLKNALRTIPMGINHPFEGNMPSILDIKKFAERNAEDINKEIENPCMEGQVFKIQRTTPRTFKEVLDDFFSLPDGVPPGPKA